jgi:hypothetical protein
MQWEPLDVIVLVYISCIPLSIIGGFVLLLVYA